MSSWLSLKRKKERDELKEEKQRYSSSLASGLSHFSRLSRAVRIGVLSSLLIVEPLLLPISAEAQEVQKAKDFKKQSSNIVKVESMAKGGDMGPVTKEKKILDEKKIKEIENLMNKFAKEPSYELYQELKKFRGTGPNATDEYKKAWDDFSKNKENAKLFGKYFSTYSEIENLKLKEEGKVTKLLEKCDQTNRLGVGTHTVVPIDEATLKFFKDEYKVEFLKKMYPSLSFSLDETDKTAPKLVIDYKIIDKTASEQLKEESKKNTSWIDEWLKKAGFNEIVLNTVGGGTKEGENSLNIDVTARGPGKSLNFVISRKYDRNGNAISTEIINWNCSDASKSESLRVEFRNLSTHKAGELNNLYYTISNKNIDVMTYFNTETEVYDVFYGIKEYDANGNHIGYTSYRIEGDPKRFLFEAQRILNERVYAIPSGQRIMYYWMMNYIEPAMETIRYGISSERSSLIASGEAYKTGILTVWIGNKSYIFDGKGSIPLPNGDTLRFSDIQIKRTQTGPVLYISAVQYTANGDPIRTVDLPIYTSQNFVYDQKTGSSVQIRLEPSKELLESVNWNRFSYTIKINENAIGYVQPPILEKKAEEKSFIKIPTSSDEEKLKDKALKLTTIIDGVRYQIQLLNVINKGTLKSPTPDLYATVVVKNLDKNEEVKTELKLDQLFNLKLGDKVISIKIESPQWNFLTTTISERVETSAIVERKQLKEGASQVTTTLVGELSLQPYPGLEKYIVKSLEKFFSGRLKFTGQYGVLEFRKEGVPVMNVEPTAYNLTVGNEGTGEGFGLTAINADPYLRNGIYTDADDLIKAFIKKKVPILGDYFGGTGYFYYKQVGKKIEEGETKAKIMKDLETHVFTAYANLPYIISGEIGTKQTKIYKEMLDSQYKTKGKEYSIFYEASDWNKGGPYILKFEYSKKRLEGSSIGEWATEQGGQGQKVLYLEDKIYLNNMSLYITSGYTTTKIPSLFNPGDIFERVRVSWDHTKIENEKRVPFTETGKNEFSDSITNNIIRLRLEGRFLSAEVYGGKKKIFDIQETKKYDPENKKWVESSDFKEFEEWLKAFILSLAHKTGANEFGISSRFEKTTRNKMQNGTFSNKSLYFSLRPYCRWQDGNGNNWDISFLWDLTKVEGSYAKQTKRLAISKENQEERLTVYIDCTSNDSHFFRNVCQESFETGVSYKNKKIDINLFYYDSPNIWTLNLMFRVYFNYPLYQVK
jgi:hypothetical protein